MNNLFAKFIYIFLIVSIYSLCEAEPRVSNYKKYNLTSTQYNLNKLDLPFSYPWAISLIDDQNFIVSEKGGSLFKVDLDSHNMIEIVHEIPHVPFSPGGKQGGLLDVYYDVSDEFIYLTYSHLDNESSQSSTAIARAKISGTRLNNFQTLLVGQPFLSENRHYGSRIAITGNYLFAGFGERGGEMIAQDPSKHPGSIIRIFKDGKIPKDNPRFKDHPDWLPEIYSIGTRNPQGITTMPDGKSILFSSHGPRGGDHIAQAIPGGNYGWKHVAWGGSEYSGFSIGDKPFDEKFKQPVLSWVPSMAISSIKFYKGEVFSEWEGDLIVCSLNGESLIRLDFENDRIVGEEIIFKDKIGRIRDFDIDSKGNIYLISDSPNSSIWKLSK